MSDDRIKPAWLTDSELIFLLSLVDAYTPFSEAPFDMRRMRAELVAATRRPSMFREEAR